MTKRRTAILLAAASLLRSTTARGADPPRRYRYRHGGGSSNNSSSSPHDHRGAVGGRTTFRSRDAPRRRLLRDGISPPLPLLPLAWAFSSSYSHSSSFDCRHTSFFSSRSRRLFAAADPACDFPTAAAFGSVASSSRRKQPHNNGRYSVASISRMASSSSARSDDDDAIATTTDAAKAAAAEAAGEEYYYPTVVVIGGSGFLGSEITRQLRERGVEYVATTRASSSSSSSGVVQGRGGEEFVSLDLTAADAGERFYELISDRVSRGVKDGNGNGNGRVAIISAMGSIGTDRDAEVNSAQATAVKSARRVNDERSDNGDHRNAVVERFVLIGNTDRVRRLARNVSFLKGYASGKDEAESTLRECFGNRGCIIKPSFIYGGDDISLQPPRLPSGLGGLASEILGLYPVQSLADELPDALALPLAPPVSVETVASAAINVALGVVEGYTEELSGEAIKMAGSVRTWKEKERYDGWLREELEKKDGVVAYESERESCSVDAMEAIGEGRRWERIGELKERLLRGGFPADGNTEIELMEELECLRPKSMKPATDPKLNGRWNFVLSKDDLGTSLIKELLPPEYYSFGSDDEAAGKDAATPPWKALLSGLYQLEGLYMRIKDEQSQVEIVLSSKIAFGKIPIDIVFSTSLLSTNYDEETEGTLFLEKFESVSLGGIDLPLPESWRRFRYLEITYLDDDVVIARGSGGEPHVLVRAKE